MTSEPLEGPPGPLGGPLDPTRTSGRVFQTSGWASRTLPNLGPLIEPPDPSWTSGSASKSLLNLQ